MGIHGSATCVMVFGADTPARGYLLGNEGDGMRIMFLMMNEARMEVGMQGLCGAAAASERPPLREGTTPGFEHQRWRRQRPRVPIVVHPDVRRMLMWQKVTSRRCGPDLPHGRPRPVAATTDAEEARGLKGYVELMTPVIKSYCSDRGYDATVIALQCFRLRLHQ